MMSNDFYIPALQSEKHSTNQWGGATVGMSSFHLQTSGCTGDQNNQREARSQDFIKTEFKGKGAERLHTG